MTQLLGGYGVDARDARVVAPVGDLDLHAHARFRAALLDATSSGDSVVLDMARVTFLDSSAIGLVVGAAKRCREAGADFRVVNAGGQPLRVMRMTGLHLAMPIDEA